MTRTSIIFFFLLLLTTVNARTVKYVELGINQSIFRNQECKSQIGPLVGLGIDYYPIKSTAVFIGTELLYQNKRLLVEDKTWPDALFLPANGVWSGDFHVNISYLVLPMRIGYSIKYNKSAFNLFTGYNLSIPIKDHTCTKNRKHRELTPDERGKIEYDYVLVQEGYADVTKNAFLGLQISYGRLALLMNYIRTLSLTDNLEDKSIEGKVDSFGMSLVILF
jgi:hypothetical protein